jgi:hypothetical protein
MTEIQALQNFGDNLNIEIREMMAEDKRKTIKKYIAVLKNASISPQLNYEQMNHFLLGYSRALKIN